MFKCRHGAARHRRTGNGGHIIHGRKDGNVYDFNTAEKLNQLLIKLLLATGQLAEGGEYDVDFDHQFLEADKYDSKRTYKGFNGYSPGVFTIGGLIAYLENRDGNANVRFMQAETHRRFFEMMRSFGIHVRRLPC